MTNEFLRHVEAGGVIGAGGAGFPTHAKLNASADLVIVNGAECEPLLQADQVSMMNHSGKLLSGLRLVMAQVGASRGIIAVKAKHHELVSLLRPKLQDQDSVSLFLLGNFYPAGDEHVLVHEVTGRVVPEGGLPLHTGVVVCNATTVINIQDALDGHAVTSRVVSVIGAVKRPVSVKLPIGVSLGEAIALAGGPTVEDVAVIIGGPMMGKVTDNLQAPITKTTGGIVVLPTQHKLIRWKIQEPRSFLRMARSVCCQCSQCTAMCPRNLLGHAIEPHRMMRIVSAVPSGDGETLANVFASAYLCSECGLCGFYSCVHGILPFRLNAVIKEELTKKGIPKPPRRAGTGAREMMEYRKVPTNRLIQRLGLSVYDVQTPYDGAGYHPKKVLIPLLQHIGKPAEPVVKPGEQVQQGQVIGIIPPGILGANVHASIAGKVTHISDAIEITADKEGS